jgi:hypothetical protein
VRQQEEMIMIRWGDQPSRRTKRGIQQDKEGYTARQRRAYSRTKKGIQQDKEGIQQDKEGIITFHDMP